MNHFRNQVPLLPYPNSQETKDQIQQTSTFKKNINLTLLAEVDIRMKTANRRPDIISPSLK